MSPSESADLRVSTLAEVGKVVLVAVAASWIVVGWALYRARARPIDDRPLAEQLRGRPKRQQLRVIVTYLTGL